MNPYIRRLLVCRSVSQSLLPKRMGSYTPMLLSELCEQKAYFYLLNAHNELVPFAVPALVGTKVVQVGPNKEQPSEKVGFQQNYLQRAYIFMFVWSLFLIQIRLLFCFLPDASTI